ncbi:MAG: outer membrane beta-barrel domain-containing protein [Pseudomonadales bacterium]
MEIRFQRVFLKPIVLKLAVVLWLSFFCLAGNVWAEKTEKSRDIIPPDLERQEIDIDAIDSEDFEISAYYGVLSIEDFGSNDVYGLRLAYHITEGLFLEAAYGQSEGGQTSFENLSGSAQLFTEEERDYKYYNLSAAYNLLPGETFIGKSWAFNSALYVIGGVGSTEFGGDDNFTVNFGVGYRVLLNDWLALQVDVRDHLFDSDLLGEEKTLHNFEFTAGFSIFF